jgi:hypothetical protein
MSFIALVGTFAAVLFSPLLAQKVMRLKGGLGKSALVAIVTIGVIQIIGMIAAQLGPLGGILGIMGALAGWYQVVRVVYGTDTASTLVFMFWHLFFQLLLLSLLQLFVQPNVFAWVFPL